MDFGKHARPVGLLLLDAGGWGALLAQQGLDGDYKHQQQLEALSSFPSGEQIDGENNGALKPDCR
jgi:hypothetical protein